jgi:putative flippase GtrA
MNDPRKDLRDWGWRFVLYGITGFLVVGVHYGIMALLLGVGLLPVLASSIGFIAGATTRFVTAYYKVFAPASTVLRTIPRFLLALAGQGLLNSALLASLLSVLPVWWAQITTTTALTILNYLVYRLWVFR